ncbi:MAG TPA: GGDEF domain-containing protein [Candidatus Aquilonibacter sp.]|nr:GGDEF domain-containing protein [Candidatus Aquilonibacter sp.]
MPGHGLHGRTQHVSGEGHATRRGKDGGKHPDAPPSDRRVVPMERRRGPADKDLEGLLSSAMLVADKELGNVVHEVDEISKALKTGTADAAALREAVHPAVWYAVKHVILERELRYLALTDELTCLYNRRGFFAAATQQLKLARRNGQGLLLFFCDLDNLKTINDMFGHREGDRALVRTADALEDVFRDSDIMARLGGDEFAVLAFEATGRHQETILHRIDKSFRKANQEEPRYELCMSVGVARFDPLDNVTLADLMAEADSAMYEEKRNKKPSPRAFTDF